MIVRIVKMKFREEELDNFLTLFHTVENKIRSFPGCNGMRLLRQTDDPTTLFTYSLWDSEEHLKDYRFSELFKDTWSKTRILFADKPQAWSLTEMA